MSIPDSTQNNKINQFKIQADSTSYKNINTVYGYSLSLEEPKVIIVLDPGHGVKGERRNNSGKFYNMENIDHGALKLKDPKGKTWGTNVEYQESDIALSISTELKKSIETKIPNATVLLTRDSEIDLFKQTELDQNAFAFRWKYANANNADIFISIHCNSNYNNTTLNGFEITYEITTGEGGISDESSPRSNEIIEKQKSLGKSIIKYQKEIKLRRDLYDSKLGALRGFDKVAILIEIGYITNASDLDKMLNNINIIACQIADGIKEYVNDKF